MQNKLIKSSTDKAISGVCGGIADYFGISSLGVRILFIILPANLLIYLILVYTIPNSPPTL
ncbi:PspC domain-containing protein [Virgibacillus sp. NKC19-16]|uniref:PspC domain-containing protein n=1 Tax=Virgibacillus salidurans TaxID=2831673 RepID=UPI001F377E11|nr:PspC domain-containing protein [Virgibacillus sp. NKC19-16]UJL47107.1 PspC domain-containing protein [Virgibacillus sp. NKC19-16]